MVRTRLTAGSGPGPAGPRRGCPERPLDGGTRWHSGRIRHVADGRPDGAQGREPGSSMNPFLWLRDSFLTFGEGSQAVEDPCSAAAHRCPRSAARRAAVVPRSAVAPPGPVCWSLSGRASAAGRGAVVAASVRRRPGPGCAVVERGGSGAWIRGHGRLPGLRSRRLPRRRHRPSPETRDLETETPRQPVTSSSPCRHRARTGGPTPHPFRYRGAVARHGRLATPLRRSTH